jgi:hypothetical protein
LLRQEGSAFVLGTLTVVDFYFIESSRASVALFGGIEEKSDPGVWIENAK